MALQPVSGYFMPKRGSLKRFAHVYKRIIKWFLLMDRDTGVQLQIESYQKLKKRVLDAALFNTQHYKVRIKGKVEKSREWSSALS